VSTNPLAGRPAPTELLVDVPKLVTAYYTEVPDTAIPGQEILFGTSGHRGSAFKKSFNESHILAIVQAVCDCRKRRGIDGPLFLGVDTHALSVPAQASALAVLAANGVVSMLAQNDEYTPTPAVSHAIVSHNRGRTAGLADGIVVNCEAIVRDMVDEEGVQPSLLHLCHNGIDTSAFHPGPTVRKAPLESAELVVGVVCGLRPEKRLDLLIDAFAKIAAPGRKLVFVGSGTERQVLVDQCERLGLTPHCYFEPTTSAVAEWIHSMDVFVLPSRTEGLSNSLMEAMACGRAVIASDAGGNPELVTDGSTGLLFPSGNADALAAALSRLVENVELRSELGARAAELIREKFSLAHAARRMAAIYLARLEASRK